MRHNSQEYSHDSDRPLMPSCNTSRLGRKRDEYPLKIWHNCQDYWHSSDLPLMLACNTSRLGRKRDEYHIRNWHNLLIDSHLEDTWQYLLGRSCLSCLYLSLGLRQTNNSKNRTKHCDMMLRFPATNSFLSLRFLFFVH